MKRGRGKSLQRVSRYAKPHIYYSKLAALPEWERSRGDEILRARKERPDRAR